MAAKTTKNETNILVAIGKLETKVDIMSSDIASARTEIKDINGGLANRMLNLEGNAVSKFQFNELDKEMQGLKDTVSGWTGSSSTWRLTLSIILAIVVPSLGWMYVTFYQLSSTLDARIAHAIQLNNNNTGAFNK
jgi:hypothetical protein